jgi:hypothetical protein
MRGYGRDYDDRNWFERAEDTVRGWFGGGPSYDRDYPASRPRADWNHSRNSGAMWSRGPDRGYGGGYRTNNWNNQHANWDTVDRAGSYSYYDSDYGRPDRYTARDRMDYDREYGMNRGTTGGGMDRGMGGMRRGMGMGGRPRGMPERGMMRSSSPDVEHELDRGIYGTSWGDYGGYGGRRFRSSSSGGVEPGRYFRGYGTGSSGGSGYEPY